MDESQPMDELARLRLEVEALRLANAALEQQLLMDAERTDAMLRSMESTGTALKAANQRLLFQSDFTQRVMDTTDALMIVLDQEGRFRQFNRSGTDELGRAGEALQGRVLDDWLHPDERRQLAEALPSLPWPVHSPLFENLRRMGSYAAEHRLASGDGKYRNYWLEASLQHNPQGQEEGAVVCATDITLLKQEQERLIRNKDLLKEAQHIAQMGHWESDVSKNELRWSDEACRILECDAAGCPRTFAGLLDLAHPDEHAALGDTYAASLSSRQPCAMNHRLLFADGRIKWVQNRFVTYYDTEGHPERSVGTLQDITAQHLASEQLSLAASVFDNSLNGILITDPQTRIIKVNHVFCEVLGYSPEEVLGQKPSMFQSEHHDPGFYRKLWASLEQDDKWQGEIWDRSKSGQVIPLWQNISAVRDESGRLIHYISVFHDLSEQKQTAKHIHHLAYYDALTDLPNRQLFNERCEHALERARRDNQKLAVLFLDLDRFKHVNDSLGHPMGDELLRKVAQRLKDLLRQGDTVARLGGDEFIILIEDIAGQYDVELVAKKLLDVLSQPYKVHGYKLEIGASVGISFYPVDGGDVTALIKHADLAMYQAKERGRGNFQFYESQLTARAKERLFLESDLREALNREEFTVYYQPLLSLTQGRIIGAEALLRWRHGERGMVPPDKFIPVAEDTGLIIAIGEWVLHTACRQAKAWLAAGYDLKRIAVNLSGVQIERSDIFATVTKVLEESGLPPERLELEITETYIMQQAQRNIKILESLRALGVTLAIDDFGTGQSSLGYLKRLPVDKLKVDRSFVKDIPQDSNDMAITRAILALGHSLSLTVLAEGVETEAQADFLREFGCDEAQGYYYSRPVDAVKFQKLLDGAK